MTSAHGAVALRSRPVLPALVAIHITLIMASKHLVQWPFQLLGQETARRLIRRVMLPALLATGRY